MTLGTFILWMGWYAFNCGSTLGASGDNAMLIGRIGTNTTVSGAFGALSSFLINAYIDRNT